MTSQEMDASRFKRRAIQTQRLTPKTSFDLADVVPKPLPTRPQTDYPASTPRRPIARTPQGRNPAVPRVTSIPVVAPVAVAQPSRPQPESVPRNIAVMTPQMQVPTTETELPVNPLPALLADDMELPGQPSPLRAPGLLVRTSRWIGVRRWAFRGVAAVLVLIIGVGGLLFSQGFLKLHKAFKGGVASAAALTANVNPNLLKGEGDGRVNVLLLGRGGGDHDGPDLTDTMMLASIDPVNHTTTLLSIPRDLWVDVPDQGAMKINAAWESGEFKYLGKIAPGSTNSNAISAGFTEADQTVENILGVPIDYNVLVDFQAFRQAVNTVNGVTVNVPTELYDPTMAWENHGSPILAKPGLQIFNGTTALNYVRSRETTSDFARGQRQRSVLVALKSKVDTLGTLSNPLRLAGLMNAFGNNVASDLSLSDASRLYGIVKAINGNDIKSVGMADAPNNYITTSMVAGQSIDVPTAGMFNYSAIQSFVRTQLPDGYILKEHAPVLVLNGTTVPGLASSTAAELKSYGYNVVGAANAPTDGYNQTTVVDLSHGKDKYTAHYLEQRFNATAVDQLPDASIQANGAKFVIIIGSDEATTQQAQAH